METRGHLSHLFLILPFLKYILVTVNLYSIKFLNNTFEIFLRTRTYLKNIENAPVV